MSAPLVVNTRDGACWTRRSVTEGGIALYALADVCSCPEFVMATLDELAARGIAGSADALPMPAGPEPKPSDGFRVVVNVWNADDRADAEWAAELTQNALEGQGFKVFATVDEGEPDVAALRARVADLAAERQTTNAALSEAAEQLRVDRDRIAELEAELYTAQAHGRTFLEQRNAHATELLKLRAERADREDEVAAAVGYTSGLEWSDLVGIVASNTTSLVQAERDVRALRARVAELEAARKQTTAHVEHMAKTLVARTEDLIAAEARVAELERRIEAEECRCPEPAPLCEGCQCRCHAGAGEAS